VRISARTGDGLEALLEKIDGMIASPFATVEALVPYERYELVSQAYEHGSVSAREDTAEGVRIRAAVPDGLADRLRAFPVPKMKPQRAASTKRAAARRPAAKPPGKPGAKGARTPARKPGTKAARRPAAKPARTPVRRTSTAKRAGKPAGGKPQSAAKRRRSARA
jgi:GTP-binding protein HflX